jgi:hypothetical protein
MSRRGARRDRAGKDGDDDPAGNRDDDELSATGTKTGCAGIEKKTTWRVAGRNARSKTATGT